MLPPFVTKCSSVLICLQVDSPLNLKHPHHLVLFMQQEIRINYLKKLEVMFRLKRLAAAVTTSASEGSVRLKSRSEIPPVIQSSCLLVSLRFTGLEMKKKNCAFGVFLIVLILNLLSL